MPVAEPLKTWLLIFDQSLRSVEGHSYNYDIAVSGAARKKFDRVLIYADRRFSALDTTAGILPIPSSPFIDAFQRLVARIFSPFRPARTRAGKESTKIASEHVGGPIHVGLLRFLKYVRAANVCVSLKRILSSLPTGPTDRIHVFLQVAGIWEIAGIDLLRALPGGLGSRELVFHLVLRSDIVVTCARSESADAFRSRLRRMAQETRSSVHFYTDSEMLAESYCEFTGLKDNFLVLPIPVLTRRPRLEASPAAEARKVRISLLGPSRMEKGFGQIETLIRNLPARFGNARTHLAIQVSPNSPDPKVREIVQWLEKHAATLNESGPVIELLVGPATVDLYFDWLARTDILIAPYDSPRYKASTSNIFVEALHFHIPTVTLSGTWMAHQIEKAAMQGLRIGEIAGTLTEFPRLFASMHPGLDNYRSQIRRYLERQPETDTALRLVEILTESSLNASLRRRNGPTQVE